MIVYEMQDSELHGNTDQQNDRLMSDFAVTRRQSRSLYRNWAVIYRKSTGNGMQSQTNVYSRISASSIGNICVDFGRESSSTLIEDRADEIVRHIEQSHTLMDDNPKSNNNRIESLREMTEYLTLKRSVKKKLIKSIGSSSKTLSFSKRLRYRISIFFCKIPVAVKHFIGSFELWYSSLKVIEGHFGSSVAGYFKFLRKLFILNSFIFIIIFFFIMIPQLLFRFIQYIDDTENFNSTGLENGTDFELHHFGGKALARPIIMMKSDPYKENGEFRLGNLFTGEGFLANTILFYGYYTHTSLKLIEGYTFNIPASYFFTSAVSYFIIFLFLFISVAVSYRKCYIEASGGMNNTFTNKVLCGWDFGIATKQAAELKSKSIYIEIKELLDDLSKPTKRKTCANTFYTTAISFSLNGILLFLLGAGGMYSWKYLDQQMAKADTATTMMMWLILTLVIATAPVLFSLIAHLEGFESPSSALYMTLIRTFTLYAVVIAVVVAYRLNRSSETECWETVLGQDMFRLVILDFIFGLIGTALSEFIRYRIFIKMWSGIGCPEFDIARSTMNLIYNQTLFYIGLYFSPVLSLIITIKLLITFYIKKWGAIYNCKPFVKPWKASQAHTVYLSIAFFAFFCVVIAYGYIITSVKTSNCGPFRGGKYMYESLLREILANKDSTILMVFYYITRPGVVGIVLMAMLLGVYYMRAVALARIHVVNHLRHLLRLKAEDRKILLNEIAKYSKNHDPPSDEPPSRGFNHTSFKRASHRFEKGRENTHKVEGKYFKSSSGDQSKLIFSSLTNLQDDKEKTIKNRPNRHSIFNSYQNINSPDDFIELQTRFNRTERSLREAGKRHEEIEYDRAQPCSSHWEDASPDCLEPDVSRSHQDLLRQDSETQVEATEVGPRLNFNPIFTESLPLESDDGEDCVDGNNVTDDRLNNKDQKEDDVDESGNHYAPNNYSKSYLRVEERVPSRISFDSDIEQRKSKTRKH